MIYNSFKNLGILLKYPNTRFTFAFNNAKKYMLWVQILTMKILLAT